MYYCDIFSAVLIFVQWYSADIWVTNQCQKINLFFFAYFLCWAETDVSPFRSYCAILSNFRASITDNSEYCYDEPSGKNNLQGYLIVNDSKQKRWHKRQFLAFILIKKENKTILYSKGREFCRLIYKRRVAMAKLRASFK